MVLIFLTNNIFICDRGKPQAVLPSIPPSGKGKEKGEKEEPLNEEEGENNVATVATFTEKELFLHRPWSVAPKRNPTQQGQSVDY